MSEHPRDAPTTDPLAPIGPPIQVGRWACTIHQEVTGGLYVRAVAPDGAVRVARWSTRSADELRATLEARGAALARRETERGS